MTRTRETALELDRAIDTIIEGGDGPIAAGEGELIATARLLREALPRLHPRFNFEEHLAARLAAARRMAEGLAPAAEPTFIRQHLVAADAEPVAEAAGEHRYRGLVAGGAIASGVSLAGAALVVWRRSRTRGIF